MRARVRSVVRRPVVLSLVILAASSAALGVAVARTRQAHTGPAVRGLAAPGSVSFHTLTTRGLVVRAAVTGDTRFLRLALVRRISPRTHV
ncbi:MAG: hypothetical protein M3P44_05020, partial [Actinomycetota bacterium]|nr:hypothetical protein [Actinomycetota bacterium]